AVAVVDCVGEAVGAVEVQGRRVRDRVRPGEQHRSVGALGEVDHRDGVAVGVAVVGGHVNRDGRVFVGRGAVVAGDRRLVDRVDGDVHAGGGCAAVAVAGGIGELVAAAEIRGGRVGHGVVGVDRHRAVVPLADGRDRQRV